MMNILSNKSIRYGVPLVAAGLLLTSVASAIPTTLGVAVSSPYVLGDIVLASTYTVPSGGQATRDMAMINTLVGMYNGTISSPNLPYVLSGNDFGAPPLPDAVATGDVITPASGISYALDGNVTITLGSGYRYLIAMYDGPNGGGTVWDLSALAAGTVVELPAFAQPNGSSDMKTGKYGITTWSLFNPTTPPPPPSVPDGGATVALLGLGLVALAGVRRRLFRR